MPLRIRFPNNVHVHEAFMVLGDNVNVNVNVKIQWIKLLHALIQSLSNNNHEWT